MVATIHKKLVFDSLNYAKILASAGIESVDVFAEALVHALSENLYVKYEVDNMIEAALKQFSDRTIQLREEMRAENRLLREEMRAESLRNREEFHKVRIEMKQITDKAVNRMTLNVGIISTLLAIVASVGHYLY